MARGDAMTASLTAKNVSAEKAAKKFCKEIAKEYEITDTGGLAYLRLLEEALIRGWKAKAAIDGQGMLYKDPKGQIRSHPLITVERDARSQALLALKALRLDVEPLRDKVGRPPSVGDY